MSDTIALLDASVGDTPAERNFRRDVDADLVSFKVSEGEFPDSPREHLTAAGTLAPSWPYDGVVISGSQTSVYWEQAWIDDVVSWVREAAEYDVPMLGVCWGHQLLAHAFGGEVADMGTYELGYHEISQVADSPLFEGLPKTFVAFETHSDEVVELPAGAQRLATNENSLQAFRLGNAFGVQFHPEYDLETARLVTGKKDLPQEQLDAILATLTPERAAEAEPAKRVFDNFLDLVARQSVHA